MADPVTGFIASILNPILNFIKPIFSINRLMIMILYLIILCVTLIYGFNISTFYSFSAKLSDIKFILFLAGFSFVYISLIYYFIPLIKLIINELFIGINNKKAIKDIGKSIKKLAIEDLFLITVLTDHVVETRDYFLGNKYEDKKHIKYLCSLGIIIWTNYDKLCLSDSSIYWCFSQKGKQFFNNKKQELLDFYQSNIPPKPTPGKITDPSDVNQQFFLIPAWESNKFLSIARDIKYSTMLEYFLK